MKFFCRAFLVCVVGLVAFGTANAADIRTYPTRLVLSPGAALGSINVKNNSTTPAAMQIEVMSWTQTDTEDKYDVTRDLLVNPVIFELAPGAEQVVRVGLQTTVRPTEGTYRIFFQELPARDAPVQSGITALLRIGIPIFVPAAAEMHALEWRANARPDGTLVIDAANKGNSHIQVTALNVLNAANESVSKTNVFTYILPGQSRHWDIKPKNAIRAGEMLNLEASTDRKDEKVQIVVGANDGERPR